MLKLQLERDESEETVAQYTMGAGLVAMHRNGDSSFYHYNHLGTALALTGADEAVTDTYRHDAWGVLLESTGDTVNPHTYVGRERYYRMPEAEMYHLGFRDYAQGLGRFMTVDPVRDGTNWFVYVSNQVPRAVDASGLIGESYPPEVRRRIEEELREIPREIERRLRGIERRLREIGVPYMPPETPQREIDEALREALACMAACGYWEEYFLYQHFDIKVVHSLPRGDAGYMDPFSGGTVYVAEDQLHDPFDLFSTLVHEAQHIHDVFAPTWPCIWHTHKHPWRTSEEMVADYYANCHDTAAPRGRQ